MNSRKSALAKLQPVLPSAAVDYWGDITATENECRVMIFARGPRRSPSCAQVYSTAKCPSGERLTRPFKLAKLISATLKMPVTFSGAGRWLSAEIKPR